MNDSSVVRPATEQRTLCWTPALRQQLAAFVVRGYPHETCGLLLGRPSGATGDNTATDIVRLTHAANLNAERARDRYELDPADFLRGDREAAAAGLEIAGIWHSHPDHPARPSRTDLEAAWEGYSYVIVSVSRDGVQEVRSWRLAGGRFEEERIEERLDERLAEQPDERLDERLDERNDASRQPAPGPVARRATETRTTP